MGDVDGDSALEDCREDEGDMGLFGVDDDKLRTARPGEERTSHKRGRRDLKGFWGDEPALEGPAY